VDVELVEGAVTLMSVEPGMAMVYPSGVDTFKSPKGEVACKGYACEDDCEEDELARGIDLPLLKSIHEQLGFLSNKVTWNSNKILKMDLFKEMGFENGF